MESLHGYLERICGPSAVPFGDETWRGLLGIATFLPRDPPGQVDSVVEPYIDDLVRNGALTLNLQRLIVLVCERVGAPERCAGPYMDASVGNGVFVLNVLLKRIIERIEPRHLLAYVEAPIAVLREAEMAWRASHTRGIAGGASALGTEDGAGAHREGSDSDYGGASYAGPGGGVFGEPAHAADILRVIADADWAAVSALRGRGEGPDDNTTTGDPEFASTSEHHADLLRRADPSHHLDPAHLADPTPHPDPPPYTSSPSKPTPHASLPAPPTLGAPSLVRVLIWTVLESLQPPAGTSTASEYWLTLQLLDLLVVSSSTRLRHVSAVAAPGEDPFSDAVDQGWHLARGATAALLGLACVAPVPPLALRYRLPGSSRAAMDLLRGAAASVLWLPFLGGGGEGRSGRRSGSPRANGGLPGSTPATPRVVSPGGPGPAAPLGTPRHTEGGAAPTRRSSSVGAPASPVRDAALLALCVLHFRTPREPCVTGNPYRTALTALADADEDPGRADSPSAQWGAWDRDSSPDGLGSARSAGWGGSWKSAGFGEPARDDGHTSGGEPDRKRGHALGKLSTGPVRLSHVPSHGDAAFSYATLYRALGPLCASRTGALLAYALLHGCRAFRAYCAIRSDPDTLLAPLAGALWRAARGPPTPHLHILLVLTLTLSYDPAWSAGLFRLPAPREAAVLAGAADADPVASGEGYVGHGLGHGPPATPTEPAPYATSAAIHSAMHGPAVPAHASNLGDLAVRALTRATACALRAPRDAEMRHAALGAIANVAPHAHGLAPESATRLLALHTALARRTQAERETKDGRHEEAATGPQSSRDPFVAPLAAQRPPPPPWSFEYSLHVVLCAIDAALWDAGASNPDLLYSLLREADTFAAAPVPQGAEPAAARIATLVARTRPFADAALGEGGAGDAEEVLRAVHNAARSTPRARGSPDDAPRFAYVEDEAPEEFFVPYSLSLALADERLGLDVHAVRLFNPDEIVAAAGELTPGDGAAGPGDASALEAGVAT